MGTNQGTSSIPIMITEKYSVIQKFITKFGKLGVILLLAAPTLTSIRGKKGKFFL